MTQTAPEQKPLPCPPIKRIPVVAGTEIVVDVLRWNEGWDFDCPVCILRPVVQFSPNGDHAEDMVEQLAINASIDGYVRDEGTEGGLVDRQFPLASLKRRWAANRRGVEFPQKGYTATRFRIRFRPDTDQDAEPDQLAFDMEQL
jgi:hypothetical protein